MERKLSEEELVHLVKAHKKEGFEILYENYSVAFYGVIFKAVNNTAAAEDILQEVFVKIWRNIDKYDSDKGRLYTWMMQIVKNASIDHIRSQGYRKGKVTDTDNGSIHQIPEAKTKEIDLGLTMLVSRMEPKYKEVIDTIFYDSYTYEEAAKKLCIPLGTLKTRARTALLMLRSSLEINAQT